MTREAYDPTQDHETGKKAPGPAADAGGGDGGGDAGASDDASSEFLGSLSSIPGVFDDKWSPETAERVNKLFASQPPGLHGSFSHTHGAGGAGSVYFTPADGTAKVNMTDNVKKALAFFKSQEGGGWTPAQAQGIVANMIAESKMNPNIHGDGGQAFGIVQMHHYEERMAKAREQGLKIGDKDDLFTQQLKLVNWELHHDERAAGNALRQAQDAATAAGTFCARYERPANVRGDSAARERIARGVELNDKGDAPKLVAGDPAPAKPSGGRGPYDGVKAGVPDHDASKTGTKEDPKVAAAAPYKPPKAAAHHTV